MIKATYVDHMGTDLSVANAARVSFAKNHEEFDDEKDAKLIRYLAKHNHISPFGHCFVSFHIKAPLFVARQLVKHKFLRWNEVSRRYVDEKPQYYTPEEWRERAENKKQGSGGSIEHQDYARLAVMDSIEQADETYQNLLGLGVCPEQARMVLPQNMYTEWYWSGSLDAFADMCSLRCKPDTQYETRLVADQVSYEMGHLFPIAWKELMDA